MAFNKRLLIPLLFLTVSPASAADTTVLGHVTAMIGETDYKGETQLYPAHGSSSANFIPIGPSTQVKIQAFDPEASKRLNNSFSADLTLMGKAEPTQLVTANISWWPEGMDGPFYISDESGIGAKDVQVNVTSLELGAQAYIKGDFTAKLCRKNSPFSEADLNDCVNVKGTIDTKLTPLQ